MFTLLLLLTSFLPHSSPAPAAAEQAVPFADPFILYDEGIYFAYGTSTDNGIAVLVSEDLEKWYYPEGRAGYLALDKKDSFGDRWFWAPEVYRIGDTYYMYYSAEEHICAAESKSPLGPFVQTEKRPMLEERGIDNTLFIDRDGTPYLFWVRFNAGNEIWMARLESDYKTVKPASERFCIRMSQPWEEIWPAVNEGPFIVEHKNTYYLTYSANSYESPQYGIGCATADSITGPWHKYADNPVYRSPQGLVGTGHHAVFRDKKGRMRVVFHAHHAPGTIHPRLMHISDLRFRKRPRESDKLTIGPNYFTPVLVRSEKPKFKLPGNRN